MAWTTPCRLPAAAVASKKNSLKPSLNFRLSISPHARWRRVTARSSPETLWFAPGPNSATQRSFVAVRRSNVSFFTAPSSAPPAFSAPWLEEELVPLATETYAAGSYPPPRGIPSGGSASAARISLSTFGHVTKYMETASKKESR